MVETIIALAAAVIAAIAVTGGLILLGANIRGRRAADEAAANQARLDREQQLLASAQALVSTGGVEEVALTGAGICARVSLAASLPSGSNPPAGATEFRHTRRCGETGWKTYIPAAPSPPIQPPPARGETESAFPCGLIINNFAAPHGARPPEREGERRPPRRDQEPPREPQVPHQPEPRPGRRPSPAGGEAPRAEGR